jgi:YVTN family beta-propeller protein
LGCAYDSGKGEIFLVNSASGTVSVLSDSNNKVVSTVTVGQSPYRDLYDSGKGEVFVVTTVLTLFQSPDKNNAVVPTLFVFAA